MVETPYRCSKDGREVIIRVEEGNDYTAIALTPDGQEIGRLEFREIDDGRETSLKLCWAYLDRLDPSYRFQGIGRECLKQVRELSGLPIFAEDNHGHRQDDGSHLTGDAVTFVARMRDEGLIAPNGSGDGDPDPDA